MILTDVIFILLFIAVNSGTWYMIGEYGLKNSWNILAIDVTALPANAFDSTHQVIQINWELVWVLIILAFKDYYFITHRQSNKETKPPT